MQHQTQTTPDAAESFAFAHLDFLAQMLHKNGHRDMALLLDGMGDLHQLAQRQAAKGEGGELLRRRDETVDYALEQLGDLARLMEQHGLCDVAALMRLPAKLQAAAERRRSGQGAEIFVLPTTRVAPGMRRPTTAVALRNVG